MKNRIILVAILSFMLTLFSQGVFAEDSNVNVIPSEDNPMSYEEIVENWDTITADMTEEELAFYTEQRDAWAGILADWDDIEAEAEDFQQNQPQTRGGIGNNFMFLDGDILVTSDSVAINIFGHAAMVCGDRVFEITSNPPNRNKTIQQWLNDRDKVVVLRRFATSRTIPVSAASYALNYYINGAGRNVSYNVFSGLNSDTVNCASLVAKCYRDGAGYTMSGLHNPTNPLDYVSNSFKNNNSFKVVYTKNASNHNNTQPKEYKNFNFSNVVYDWVGRNMSGHCYKYYKEAGIFNTLSSNGGTISPNRSVNVTINLTETNERIALQNIAGQGRASIWYFDYMSTKAIGQRTYMAVSTKSRYSNATRVAGSWSPDSR